MTKKKAPDSGLVESVEGEPIVLVGQPDSIQGELYVRNPGEKKIVVRDAQVRAATLRATPMSFRLAPIPLRPGLRRRVPLAFAIDPGTPPGEYKGELEIDGSVHPVVLHVTEKIRLDISPDPLVVPNLPGETVVKRVIFRNLGNVPLTIGEIGGVPLDDELLQCRTFRAALSALGEETKSLEAYALDVARQLKGVVEQAGLLRVHNAAGVVELEPGAMSAVDLEIRLPKTLDKRTRYRGEAPLYTSSLRFFVVPAPREQTTNNPK